MKSYWIPTNLYPDDGRLRVLLVAGARASVLGATIPQVGCRQQGKWYVKELTGNILVELGPSWMVTGWQPIQYESDSTVTDDDLRRSFIREVRVSAKGSAYPGDVVGWFRKHSAQLVAERVYLRAMVEAEK